MCGAVWQCLRQGWVAWVEVETGCRAAPGGGLGAAKGAGMGAGCWLLCSCGVAYPPLTCALPAAGCFHGLVMTLGPREAGLGGGQRAAAAPRRRDIGQLKWCRHTCNAGRGTHSTDTSVCMCVLMHMCDMWCSSTQQYTAAGQASRDATPCTNFTPL